MDLLILAQYFIVIGLGSIIGGLIVAYLDRE